MVFSVVAGLIGSYSMAYGSTKATSGCDEGTVRLDKDPGGAFNPTLPDGSTPNPKYMAPLDQGEQGACWAFAGAQLQTEWMLRHPERRPSGTSEAAWFKRRTSPYPEYFNHCAANLSQDCTDKPPPGGRKLSHDIGNDIWSFLDPSSRSDSCSKKSGKLCSCSHASAAAATWQNDWDSQNLWACALAYIHGYNLDELPRCREAKRIEGATAYNNAYFQSRGIDRTDTAKLAGLVCADLAAKGLDVAATRTGTAMSAVSMIFNDYLKKVGRQLYPPEDAVCPGPERRGAVYQSEVEPMHMCMVSSLMYEGVCTAENTVPIDFSPEAAVHVSSELAVEGTEGKPQEWDDPATHTKRKADFRVTIDSRKPAAFVNASLAKHKPVAVSLCFQAFEDHDYYPVEFPTVKRSSFWRMSENSMCGDRTSPHAVLVIGREKRNGQCMYLLRNSAGTDCNVYHQTAGGVANGPEIGRVKECRDAGDHAGNVWISEKDMRMNLENATAIGSPGP